jgi:hypothetical protein
MPILHQRPWPLVELAGDAFSAAMEDATASAATLTGTRARPGNH